MPIDQPGCFRECIVEAANRQLDGVRLRKEGADVEFEWDRCNQEQFQVGFERQIVWLLELEWRVIQSSAQKSDEFQKFQLIELLRS